MSDTAILNFSDQGTKRMVLAHVKTLTGYYWFEVRRCRDQRTLDQNAYFHSVVCHDVAAYLSDVWGEKVDMYEAKEFLKDQFLKKPIIDHRTGEVKGYITRGTSDLDTGEFSQFLEQCFKFATDNGFEIREARKYRDRVDNEAEIEV